MPLETALPVPLRRRVDGWTPERQRTFLAALAKTRSVTRAVRAVGLSASGAYRLRDHAGAADFAAAWDEALCFRPKCGRRER